MNALGNIRENLEEINGRVRSAALRSGRKPEEISLIAVTKTVRVDAIREAKACGVKYFGENRVQEALPKIQALGADPACWHFVGHLQTNKARQIIGLFDLIHSVDSLRLAQALEASLSGWSKGTGMRQKVMIQVNVSGEKTKSGVYPEQAAALIKDTARCKSLSVVGLMTIPPPAEDAEQSRPYFRLLRELARSIEKVGIEGICLRELSMGMSADFEVAIEEGSSMIRIGTALFGPRAKFGNPDVRA